MSERQLNYRVYYTVDRSGLTELKQELKNLQSMTFNDLMRIDASATTTQLNNIKKSAQEVENALKKAFNADLGTVNVTKLNHELKNLDIDKIYKDLSSAGAVGRSAFRTMANEVLSTNIQLKESHQILDKFAASMKNTVKWGITSDIFNRMSNSIQSAWNFTKALDSSLTDIRIVSSKSADEMERFARQANNAAQALGKSTRDYTEASLIYYQQGLSDEEVAARTETTLKAANVTGQKTSQVSEQLTAVWNGYRVSAAETEKYVDKLAAVAASTASDLEELSTSMSKVAAAANTAGVDFDQLNAILSTVISVTREAPETIGSSFKTIFARLGDLAIDGEDEFGVTLGKVSGQMEELGIQILDEKGNMIDMGTIIEDTAEKWKGWTQAQKQAAAVAMGGKMQYSRLITLFENWDKYGAALSTSADSLGTLQEQQDKYMESTQAHLNQLSTAWERVFNAFVDNKSINDLIDVLTGATNTLANFIESIGGGGKALLSLGAIATNVFQKQIGDSLSTVVTNIRLAAENTKDYQSVLENINLLENSRSTSKDPVLQQMIANIKELHTLQGSLGVEEQKTTQELYKQLNMLLEKKQSYTEEKQQLEDTLGALTRQKVKIDEINNASSQTNTAYNKTKTELAELVKLLEKIKTSSGKDGINNLFKEDNKDDLKNFVNDLQRVKQLLNEINKSGKMPTLGDNKFFQTLNSVNITKNLSGGLKEYLSDGRKYSTLLADIQKQVGGLYQEFLNIPGAVQKINKDLEGTGYQLVEVGDKVDKVKQKFQDINAGQTFAKLLSGLTSVFSVLSTATSIGDIIKNEDLSGWEKFVQIGMNVTMIASMATMAFKNMKAGLIGLGPAIKKVAADMLVKSGADLTATASTITLNVAMKTLLGTIGSTLATLAPYIAVIGAVTLAIYAGVKAYNADADAAKRDAEAVENLQKVYEETKTKVEEFQNSLKSYDEAIKNTKQLTKGTVAYKEAVIKANEQALALLNTNKELAKYAVRNEEGMITFSQQGINEILNQQLEELEQKQNWLMESQLRASKSQLKSDITDFQRANKYNIENNKSKNEELGQYGQGNIDLWNRPVYKQSDGSISTVESVSFWDEQEQKEILVPLIHKIGDNIVEVTAEEAQRIYEETGKYLGKFDNAAAANQYAAKLHEAQDYYYNNNKGTSGREQVPTEILQDIANYMRKNNLTSLIPSDLAKIDSVASASSDLQKSIYENIKAYIDMANEINNTKNEQQLYASAIADARLKLVLGDDYDKASEEDKIVYQSLLNQYNNNGKQKEEDKNKYKEDEYSFDAYLKKYYGVTDVNNIGDAIKLNAASEAYADSHMFNATSADLANQWRDLHGYDRWENAGFLGLNGFDFYDKDGNKVDWISGWDATGIQDRISEIEVEKQYAKKAGEEAPAVIQSVDEFVNSLDLEGVENLSNISKLLKSATLDESGKGIFSALIKGTMDEEGNGTVADVMSQEMAKALNTEENKEVFKKLVGDSDFWQRQGFETADEYTNAFFAWIEQRANTSDVEALGETFVKTNSEKTNKVVDQLQSGELTATTPTDEYKELKSDIEALARLYPELQAEVEIFNTQALIGTEAWSESLYNLQEKLNDLNLERLEDNVKKAEDNLRTWLDSTLESEEFSLDATVNIDGQDKKFKDVMDALLNAEYAVDVEIHAQAKDAFDTFTNSMDNLEKMAEKIGDDYKVATNELYNLNLAFPGILENMNALGDGTTQLSQESVKNAMIAAKENIRMSAQETLSKLQDQKTQLEAQKARYQTILKIAQAAQKGEIDSQEAATQIKNTLLENEAENDEETSNTKMDNAKIVADDSNINAGIMEDNWDSAYKSASDSAIAFANTAVSAAQAAQTGNIGDVQQYQKKINYQGKGGQTNSQAKLAQINKDIDTAAGDSQWDSIIKQSEAGIALIDSEINSVNGMIYETGARLLDMTTSLNNVQRGLGTDGKRDKSGSKNKPDKMDALEDEKDRYHDIDIILKQIETDLGRLEKQKDKLFGQDLIDNLNKQLQTLDKQIDATNEKIRIARGEAGELRNQLSGYGTTFNADGTIANYAQVYQAQLDYVNSLIAQYNSMSKEQQEAFKETVETAKANFDKFTEAINNYDTLISDTIPGLQDEIQDAIDKEIEIKIEEFTMEIEIRLDLSEAERDWNEFKRKVIDSIKDDDILGNTKARLRDFSSYYKTDGTGEVQALTQQVLNTKAQLEQMDKTGTSDWYGDNRAKALEDLKSYTDQLMQSLGDVEDLVQEIKDSYLDMMDEAAEKFGDQIDLYEQVRDIITHDMNVIELVYGEESYKDLAKYYEKQEENYNKQLDFNRQQKDFWYNQMIAIEKAGGKNSEAWLKAKENWMDAVNEWNSAIEEAIENLQNKYQNAINLIFQGLNNKVTGGLGLEYVSEEWELINKNADQYLDTINSLYGIQSLENKYLDAIDNTDSISAQRKLNELMEQEVSALREKDKLTQYDVDRANMKYEIALKQIALEEAQQNKSTMRLRRDSQGNYTYQYVADEDQVGKIQDELSALKNELYNFDLQHYKDNLDQVLDIWTEFQEKMAEAALINDPEERQERELLLREQYGELINGLVEQNEDIRMNLHESAFTELADLYGIEYANFQQLSEDEKTVMMEQMIPQWDSAVQHMTDTFAGNDEGEGGFLPTCRDAFKQLDDATKQYQTDLGELQQAAGTDFDNIRNGIDENIGKTQELITNNDELIRSYQDQLSAIGAVITELQQLVSQYNAARDAAIEATQAAYGYWKAQQQQAANAAGKNVSSGGGSSNSGNSSSNNNSNSGKSGSGSEGSGGGASVGNKITYSGKYYYDSFGTSPAGSKYSGVADGVTIDIVNNNPYGIHVKSSDGKYPDLGWIKRSQVTRWNTGGYTGDWGDDSGRLAILDRKELVLNKEDTPNVLNAIEIMRDITSSMNLSMLSRMAKSISGIQNSSNAIAADTDTLEQNVHIDATFPGVKDAKEIEQALNNLVNVASQRIGHNRR